MAEELDQIVGQISGLFAAVKQLSQQEEDSWVYVTKRLLFLPVDEKLDAVYVYFMGKAQLVQMDKTEAGMVELKEYISAENALCQVTNVRRMLDVDNYSGPWQHEVMMDFRSTSPSSLVDALMYHLAAAQQKTLDQNVPK